MFRIITPEEFQTVPWKNGKGETIEMAINDGGTLADFDWRLSMASVVEDGIFSNFSGYTRNLILIDGHSINLQHDNAKIDKLSSILDIATFDGGCKTVGNLPQGEITDFNIITRTEKYRTNVATYTERSTFPLKPSTLCFIYSLSGDTELVDSESQVTRKLPAQHLLHISENKLSINVTGENLIVVYLDEHK